MKTEALPLRFKFHIPKTSTKRIDTEAEFENSNDKLKDMQQVSEEKNSWFKSK